MSNYYTALIDSHQPDVHITLRYYKNLTPAEVAELDKEVRHRIAEFGPKPFDLDWGFEGWFGRNNSVRVLQPKASHHRLIPQWVYLVGDTQRSWAPHVTTEEDSIQMRIDRVEVRCKSNTISAYPLEKEYGRGE